VAVLSVARALRALARFRVTESPRERLTPTPSLPDPPVEAMPPVGEPPPERIVQIPLYLEP
jgi:hypothetical protein